MESKSGKVDVNLQKVVALMQKCRDMSLDCSKAKLCFDLGIKEYTNERYESADALFENATKLMLDDIYGRRKEIGFYRIRNTATTPSVALSEGVRLWPMFNGGSMGGLITPEMQSPTEYTGLVGEIQVEGGHALDSQRYNMEEFYYILYGQGVMSLEGQEMNVRAGDWICIPNNWLHSIRPLNSHCPIRFFVARSYADKKTSELVAVGTDPLSIFKSPTPYTGSAVQAINELAARTHEATSTGASIDMGCSLYREADFYIEIVKTCFGKNDLGVQKYAALAIDSVQRFIEDAKHWESYKSDVNELKATCAMSEGGWFHNRTSIDWLIFADKHFMKPEWGRPVTSYTQVVAEWETPAGKSFYAHTHNTEEFYYLTASLCGMKIGPTGTNEFAGDEEEFLLYPGDCLFIPPNTRHVARSVSNDYPLHSLVVGSYTDEVLTGDAAVY